MKKSLFFIFLPCFALAVRAQNGLTITSGTDLYIPTSDILHVDGLSLTPSAPFILNGTTVTRTNTVTNSGLSNAISRTYLFSTATPAFAGTIRLEYLDAELAGANESQLQVQTYNGTTWQLGSATTRDAVNNYVEVAGLSNRMLSEITLSATTTLALGWKGVSALRSGNEIVLEWSTAQESGVLHFSIERNTGEDWQVISSGIPAHNNGSVQHYRFVDNSYTDKKAYYRIVETDRDGRKNYSPLMVVAALPNQYNVRLYPNPVQEEFYLQLETPGLVKIIQLYHTSGALVKTWRTTQNSYNVAGLPSGMYQLCIIKEGCPYFIPLIKK